MNNIVIFESGEQGVQVRLDGETLWLTQRQMAEVFATTPENVLMHLKNIFREGELDEAATAKDFSAVRQEGARQVRRRLKHYNLDAIISIGYRVNSTRATGFRQWATQVLRQHLTQGYSLARERFEQNAAELEAALLLVRKAAAGQALTADLGRGLVDVISALHAHVFVVAALRRGAVDCARGQPGRRVADVGRGAGGHCTPEGRLDGAGRGFRAVWPGAWRCLRGALGQSGSIGLWRGGLSHGREQGRAPFVFRHQKPSVCQWQQAQWRFFVCGFSGAQWPLAAQWRAGVINDVGLAALALLVAESDAQNKDVMIRLIENMLALPGNEER